jgi:hypothetical protein
MSGLTCLRIETGCWALVNTVMNLRVPLNAGIAGLAENRLASQEGLCYM